MSSAKSESLEGLYRCIVKFVRLYRCAGRDILLMKIRNTVGPKMEPLTTPLTLTKRVSVEV